MRTGTMRKPPPAPMSVPYAPTTAPRTTNPRGAASSIRRYDVTMAPKIHPDWQLVDADNVKAHHLERTWKFSDWLTAVAFVNKVSPLAEALQHHPDVEL